jgi:DNA-binding CsgD family transcriptional regulator
VNHRLADRNRRDVAPELLDLLAAADPPAFATDADNRVVFWNRGAERVLGRRAEHALGRQCHEIMGGRDIFGNRFCHESCGVIAMTRKGEPVHGFEIVVPSTPGPDRHLSVTILQVPAAQPDAFTIVHVLTAIDESSRLARALEQIGATATPGENLQIQRRASPAPVGEVPLTGRQIEILRWVSAGLQNKEIAQKLDISLATVRNHIHNILEKLGVHSKLEAVSLAFRRGWVAGDGSR